MQQQDRFKTILVIVTGLLVLSCFPWGRFPDLPFFTRISRGFLDLPMLARIGLVVGLVSIFIPAAAKAIEWFWLKLAFVLGWINSRILLSIIYFLFLLPIAWISRLFTKDPLALRGNKSPSLFVTRNHLYSKKDLENIW